MDDRPEREVMRGKVRTDRAPQARPRAVMPTSVRVLDDDRLPPWSSEVVNLPAWVYFLIMLAAGAGIGGLVVLLT